VDKRPSADGAALLWVLPDRRSNRLLCLLVAYEAIADFLDDANEHGAAAGTINGSQLHRAIVEATDARLAVCDHYRHHPWCGDGGYLHTLVAACRSLCVTLPSYAAVRASLRHTSTLATVQALNHEPDRDRRTAVLRRWANCRFPDRQELSWFELTAEASAWLDVLVLMALAAEPACSERVGTRACAGYFWVSLAATVLDSYGDGAADVEADAHNYLARYPTCEVAVRRIREIVERSMREACALPNGHRHAVIVACMVALCASKTSARTPEMRAPTRGIVRAGGSLTRLLVPILRAWRIVYGQRDT
jgi:tetraprenyl-beta-curcumene synthase